MRKHSKIALVVALSVGLLSTAAIAAPSNPPVIVLVRTIPGTTPGDPNACTAICPQPGVSEVNYKECTDKLAQLRRVTPGQVRRIDGYDTVHLVPLCDTVNHTLTDTQTEYLAPATSVA